MKKIGRHAKIFKSDLQLQSFFKSRHTSLMYQTLILYADYPEQVDIFMTREIFPKQSSFQKLIPNITKYRIQTGLREMKNIKFQIGQTTISLLEVTRTGRGARYKINTPIDLEIFEHVKNQISEHVKHQIFEHVENQISEHVENHQIEIETSETEENPQKTVLTKQITNNYQNKEQEEDKKIFDLETERLKNQIRLLSGNRKL